MSAPGCLAFYGLRFAVQNTEELEELEERSHRLFRQARCTGLRCYWGNFADPDERFFAFLGKTLGVLGMEDSQEASLGSDELRAIMAEVAAKLADLGYQDTPRLYLQWMPDA